MKFFKIAAVVAVLLAVAGYVLFATGFGQGLMFRAYMGWHAPAGDFDPAAAAPAPDYSDAGNWAALPWSDDPSNLVPAGVDPGPPAGTAPVDVFFIHPTGYLRGASWTAPLDANSATEENTRWMLANQASAFNGCCNVYAPRYRQATIFAYVARSPAERDEILDFAYQDVLRAFRHFLAEYNHSRPFIIASHSQGTHHVRRLLAEEIDATPLHAQMVAAYAIGSVVIPYSQRWFAGLSQVKPCDSATETGCVVHWDTVGEGGDAVQRDEDSLCTNPLSWRVDEEVATADRHRGAVPGAGVYTVAFRGEDVPLGTQFTELAAPLPRHTWAQCRGGTLFVADQSGTPMMRASMGLGASRNYHGLDYPLFHMDIRDNAAVRVAEYLARRDAAAREARRPSAGSAGSAGSARWEVGG